MIEATDLLRLAMTHADTDSPAVLARALGYSGYDAPRRVRRWRDGENEPDYRATIELLEFIGAVSSESLQKRLLLERAEALKGRARRRRSRREAAGGS